MELSHKISNLIFEIQKLTQEVEKISKTQEISVD
ncbi:AAA family ATPase, partial [Acinetobacter baumannii]